MIHTFLLNDKDDIKVAATSKPEQCSQRFNKVRSKIVVFQSKIYLKWRLFRSLESVSFHIHKKNHKQKSSSLAFIDSKMYFENIQKYVQ